MNKYPHIIYADTINVVNYPCKDLHDSGFQLIAVLHENNPDFMKFVEDNKKSGHEVKIIHSNVKNDNSLHIWVKYKTLS